MPAKKANDEEAATAAAADAEHATMGPEEVTAETNAAGEAAEAAARGEAEGEAEGNAEGEEPL